MFFYYEFKYSYSFLNFNFNKKMFMMYFNLLFVDMYKMFCIYYRRGYILKNLNIYVYVKFL